MQNAIDADVTLNPLGFYELKPQYRKNMDSFYEDEYYQNNYALYRAEYDGDDLEYKSNLYRQKEYIVKSILGGVSGGTTIIFGYRLWRRLCPCMVSW